MPHYYQCDMLGDMVDCYSLPCRSELSLCYIALTALQAMQRHRVFGAFYGCSGLGKRSLALLGCMQEQAGAETELSCFVLAVLQSCWGDVEQLGIDCWGDRLGGVVHQYGGTGQRQSSRTATHGLYCRT